MESPYPHLTACKFSKFNNVIKDLRKNTENCFNNWKSSFECDFFTMASLNGCLSAAVSSQRNELHRFVKQEYFVYDIFSSKIIKMSISKKGEIWHIFADPVTYNYVHVLFRVRRVKER